MKKVIRKSESVLEVISNFLVDLPSPSSLSYMWNFGSLLGVFLLFQIVTGMFLAIHFTGDVNISFFSVIHIMRDISWGWAIRVLHSNGASSFFLLLYLHIGRGLYYGSYRLGKTWMSGVTIFLLSMITAFLGYVLPWGQMSFWAATVITNLLSAVPYIGVILVEWVWGGYAVSNPTLTRFFSFHFILPFIILGLVIVHLMFLHETGSSNPLGLMMNVDKISFHPYYISSDIVGVVLAFMFLFLLSMMHPFVFMDSENFIPSNPLVTPVHIQPEWYFLFAYAILRSIPSKIGGVVALMMSVLMLYFIPIFYNQSFKTMCFYWLGRFSFWLFVIIWMVLTWIGAREVESPYIEIGKLASFFYFVFFFVMWLLMKIQDNIMN
uniref:Cytochrome b n=1 Tax=Cyriopagopus schmidti TaxID=29017 RepID=Q6JT21_CYRSC|nr:cytochrome b [Cyriopagopus schmidti]AAP51157.1 cytochrome b [Cyriopagopus schmidti]